MVADKLCRLGQIIQTEWSLVPEIFQLICTRWHQPQIELFAMRFNIKLPHFVSPVPDSLDALSLPWKDLEPFAFQTSSNSGEGGRKTKGLLVQENLSQVGPTCPGSGI